MAARLEPAAPALEETAAGPAALCTARSAAAFEEAAAFCAAESAAEVDDLDEVEVEEFLGCGAPL